ncbi:HAD-IIIA family hydrolase [Microbacterium sp. STN6]|uniref:D-glycero-alpha-D-manno-heptose-1,7-bisphosphate 7-phosphatase n=1 Tax=Microbacterium sp. STN6 TaxID=2995588 RepID=UPI002260AD5B|nr:HAD-IIIA family hydrolase [Microbacterium sp. STN6]MCX7523154.1 HAD-IIIA family hydrolase [Microbacterium sp. STN6]
MTDTMHEALRGVSRADALDAILFDRDGTLIRDVPGIADPAAVEPMPTAADAVRLARDAGLATGVVTNQAALARGVVSAAELDAVNARVDALLGPFDVWQVCPHSPEDSCDCRKPRPGLVLEAARQLGTAPQRVAVIGDIGTDMDAARHAGAVSVLVPTPVTRPDEVAAAPLSARTLAEAVRLLLHDRGDAVAEHAHTTAAGAPS